MITTEQVFGLINEAAQNNNLVHFNGGQAYIRLSDNVIMITDHTGIDVRIEVVEGTNYLNEYGAGRFYTSKCYREKPLVLTNA